MKEAKGPGKPVDLELEGATVEAHGYMVTPVARVRGQMAAGGDERGRWEYAWAAIRPARMTVRDVAGQANDVKLVNSEGMILTAMAFIGLVVAAVSLLVAFVAREQR